MGRRNKSLHRQQMMGGKWQKSIAVSNSVSNEENAAGAINFLHADVNDPVVQQFRINHLIAELVDDLDRRVSQLEDRLQNQ